MCNQVPCVRYAFLQLVTQQTTQNKTNEYFVLQPERSF